MPYVMKIMLAQVRSTECVFLVNLLGYNWCRRRCITVWMM